MHVAASRQGRRGRLSWAGPILVALVLVIGCRRSKQTAFQDSRGFRIAPPPGWVTRAREDALPARSSHRQQDLPLPALGGPGQPPEHLVVRYDRLTSEHAWLRVSLADIPSSTPLSAYAVTRSPGHDWKRQADVESLEVGGQPAARIAFAGRWAGHDYVNETVAVRQGEQVYVLSASFPASDSTAREEVRQAIAAATWR